MESVYDNTINCDKLVNTVNLLLCMDTEIHIKQDFTLSFSFRVLETRNITLTVTAAADLFAKCSATLL